jgi:hypothetical protein
MTTPSVRLGPHERLVGEGQSSSGGHLVEKLSGGYRGVVLLVDLSGWLDWGLAGGCAFLGRILLVVSSQMNSCDNCYHESTINHHDDGESDREWGIPICSGVCEGERMGREQDGVQDVGDGYWTMDLGPLFIEGL